MVRVALVLIVLGGVLGFIGFKEARLGEGASAEPQHMTAQELIDNGPGENVHLILHEFVACEFSYVVFTDEGRDEGPYEKVFIPILAEGGQWHRAVLELVDEDGNLPRNVPMPEDIRVIAKLKNIRDDDRVSRMMGKTALQGMVINEIASLGSDTRRILSEQYPGVDFDTCYILEVGRKPAGSGKLVIMFGGGGALVLAGVAVLVFRSRKSKAKPAAPKPAAEAAPEPDAAPAETTGLADDNRNPYARSE